MIVTIFYATLYEIDMSDHRNIDYIYGDNLLIVNEFMEFGFLLKLLFGSPS